MKTTHDILMLLSNHKPEWEQRFQLQSLAVFGSYARDEQHEQSDVDITDAVIRKFRSDWRSGKPNTA